MLTQLSITNFRCFRQLDVELKPLTVLIGPNDTGKSVFQDAVEYLGPSDPSGLGQLDRFRGDIAGRISVRGTLANGEVRDLETKRPPQQSHFFGGPLPQPKPSDFEIQRFQLPATGVLTGCDGFKQEEVGRLFLERDGRRVAALIDHLLRADLEQFLELRNQLRQLVPGFEDLKVETPTPQARQIEFVVESGFRIPAQKTSAGVRLLLFFLALVHHPIPPRVILLEEPETGIHPKRLQDVMELLRGISQGKFGKAPAQVILTTHSPYLLDYVKPEEDQVLVFQRDDDGSRTAKPVDWSRLKEFFEGFMLGEVWFNEGEAGLVARGAS